MIKKDMELRTMESIHGVAACYAWPRHVVGFKRSREGGGEGTEAQLASMMPKTNQVGPHASETTSHGLILGNQPKLLPSGPKSRFREAMPEVTAETSGRISTPAVKEKVQPKERQVDGVLSIWDDRSWGEYQK